MGEPDYIVFRPAAGLPAGFVPPLWDGRWVDRSSMPVGPPLSPLPAGVSQATVVPTGRFEVRDHDGTVAEVWEIKP